MAAANAGRQSVLPSPAATVQALLVPNYRWVENGLVTGAEIFGGYANNQAEVSHQPTLQRERHMRRFKSVAQAQRFLAVHDVVRNLFTVGRHRLRAGHHRDDEH